MTVGRVVLGVLLRLICLAALLVAAVVAVAFFAAAWLPAFVLFGGRGLDWALEVFAAIVCMPLTPFTAALEVGE